MSDTLDLSAQFAGARLVVLGGTGFLGKVWLSQLLYHWPEVEHIWLVVRPKGDLSSHDRFWTDVATNKVFDPLRKQHGDDFYAFLEKKITPIAGDVSEPFAGVAQEVRDELRGRLTAVVNSAGVVDFNPPLDYALNVNAFGMQNLVELCRDLGDCNFLHTSTCYVAGGNTGQVDEVDPLSKPFPRAHELDEAHWSPDREIAECVDLVDHVRHRVGDAFRQSHFLDQAKQNLRKKGEPCRGSALDDELIRVRDGYEREQLVDVGMERARYWGWHNTYTYTKSIGEQVLCRSELPFTIVRPAVIESAVAFPEVGWAEGVNTMAPVLYLGLNSPGSFPCAPDSVLDIIPVDLVASGMSIALAALIEGTHQRVYQLGSSDTNPLLMTRIIELSGLHKRRYLRTEAPGNPLINAVRARIEPTPQSAQSYIKRGPAWLSSVASQASGVLKGIGGPLAPITRPAAKALEGASKGLKIKGFILDQFLPFMATHNYRFATTNIRAEFDRLSDQDQLKLPFRPQDIDWRDWMMNVQIPGMQRNVFPLIDERISRPRKPLRGYDHLIDLVAEMADRHGHMPALMLTTDQGLERISFIELQQRVDAAASRLFAAGVRRGDRVLLSGNNHPAWPIAWFAIIRAGGVVVPVDPALEAPGPHNIVKRAEITLAVVDSDARAWLGDGLPAQTVDLHAVVEGGAPGPLPDLELVSDDLASILFTSGTTGEPKGVMLTHGNFTSLLGSLGTVFPLRPTDRVLSVLPLHHTFEFTCGLLLPLSRGSRILYLDEISGERLSHALREGRITAMVGVPALWQLLERRIRSEASSRGKLAEVAFDGALAGNRWFGAQTGVDLGRLMFGSVHSRLGGNIRLLISGGAALPKDTHALFSGLGLHLAEGYGLTEAAPVLSVSKGSPGARAGNVGKAIPGVQLKIASADDNGVGEVLAKGPNVMKGYFADEDATKAAVDEDGWLHTGDLGRIDHKGRLVLVGRAKDVVVTASGENLYLDDIEKRIGTIPGVDEYALVGINDPRGGERLAMLAVPQDDATTAKTGIRAAIAHLPAVQQPAVVHTVDAELPRTATRKVQRKAVRETIERIVAATAAAKGNAIAGPVVTAVASIAGKAPGDVTDATHLREDLGFDSLMWVELAGALEALPGHTPDADALSDCDTVGDVVALTRNQPAVAAIEDTEPSSLVLPEVVRTPLKEGLRQLQMAAYGRALDTRVVGRAFIPQNRPTIVVSNHTSHLDMGLVKYALGPYGQRIRGLAAKDYFFAGNRWWVTYFEQLTNLAPIDRERGFRASLEQASQVVEEGHVVLLFPEGTRRTDGTLGEFKPLVGKLALQTGVDILPLHIAGTYDILPKGSFVPKGRKIEVRIGPPLEVRHLRRLVKGMKPADAARAVARLAHDAVAALGEGRVLDPSQIDALKDEPVLPKTNGVADAFASLEERINPQLVSKPVSWYFSLGGKDGPRYTVTATPDGAVVRNGRPQGGKADCVVKTSADMMSRIINDAYLPTPPEFVSGAIKTNDIPLIIEFARVFQLNPDLPA